LFNNDLGSRACVFQELLLAPRTLHFTTQQLVFDCRSSMVCETFPESFHNGVRTIPALKAGRWHHFDVPTATIADKWATVVHSYSKKTVTFSRDKLIALSGVARLFAKKFGTTYLAGMWKEDLARQLAWQADEPSRITIRDHMPSWSWASIDSEVTIHRDHDLLPDCVPLV
jgi:hypothetical protein